MWQGIGIGVLLFVCGVFLILTAGRSSSTFNLGMGMVAAGVLMASGSVVVL